MIHVPAFTHLKSMSSLRNKIHLEVERKFSQLRVYPLHQAGGTPGFHRILYLGSSTFTDTYFDKNKLLADKGIWLRQRDGKWEGKVRQAGNFINSQFREVNRIEDIQDQVGSLTGSADSKHFGLSQTATIKTFRETWKANDRFTVVLDRTDFGHEVGEVELAETVTWESNEQIKIHSQNMDDEIERFMRKYHWAFGDRPAIGKLTAFFADQKLMHKRCESSK